MKIKLCDLQKKNLKGIYCIKNIVNNICYYGSVSKASFKKRFSQHVNTLRSNRHENSKLQHSFNKYGENNFEFLILEILEDNILEKEQEYLNKKEEMFNVHKNAFAPPNIKTIKGTEKQSISIKISNFKAKIYYEKFKKDEISLNNIPIEYKVRIKKWINHKPWNKGLTKEKISYDFLKGIPKTKSEKYDLGRISFKEKMRNKGDIIELYDYNCNYIKSFKCLIEIIEYTSVPHDLPLILKSNKNRKSKKHGEIPYYKLEGNNILKVCKGNQKHHKGLIFKYQNDNRKIHPLKPQDIFWNKLSFDSLYFYNKPPHEEIHE